MFSESWITNTTFVITFLIATISIPPNLLVLVSSVKLQPLINVDILLIFILASIDLLYSVFVFVSQIIIWILPHSLLYENSIFCWVSIGFFSLFAMNNVCFLSILAITRYMCIVKKLEVKKYLIIISTALVFIFNMVTLGIDLAISTPKVMPSGAYCSPRTLNPTLFTKSFVFFFNISTILKLAIFLGIIYFSYYFIMLEYYRLHIRNLINEPYIVLNNMSTKFNQNIKHRLNVFIFKAVVMLVGYTITVMPDLVTIIPYVLYNVKITPIIDLICVCLRSLMPFFNAIFVLILHDNLKHEVKRLLPHWI